MRPTCAHRLSGVASLLVPLVVAAAAPAAAQEPRPEVVEVRFVGAEALDEALLREAIVTRPTGCRSPYLQPFCALGIGWALERRFLDPAALEQDRERLETLLETWGYPDAEVATRVLPRGANRAAVVFDVETGRPIRVASLEIRGLEAFVPPVELPFPLPLRVGEPYSLPRLTETEQLIRRALAERGRPYATVEAAGTVDEEARVAHVVLEVDPGPPVVFGEPEIVAERPIDVEVVRERVAFAPGEPFRPALLAETERRIRQLPIVEEVTIEAAGLERGDTVIAPRIAVEAGRTQAIQVEGTISSVDCLELALFWRHRYFLGGPRLFSLGVGVANLLARPLSDNFPCTEVGEGEFADPEYFVEADLRQPWPGDYRSAILASAFYRKESAPRAYILEGYGGRLGVAREFSPALFGSLIYAPERNQLDAADVYFCANFGVCDPEGLSRLTGYTWLAPIESLVFWTPTGPPTQVRRALPGERWRGWARGDGDGAGAFTGSDYDYARGIGEGAMTRLFGTRAELAGRTRLGGVAGGEVLPPQVRLYSGGVNTVRGVPQNFLGPKVLVVGPDEVAGLGCTPVPGGCPLGLSVSSDEVTARPVGGNAVIEASVEGRLWAGSRVQLAAFTDFGVLFGALSPPGGALAEGEQETLVTPGVGVRILTGLGPIRIDVGYDPSGARTYPLFTSDPVTGDVVFLGNVRFDRFTFDDPGGLREFWRRLQLHVAIGQPY